MPSGLPEDLDVASLTPSQLAEAEFVSAQLASLTASTTETANTTGAQEIPVNPGPVPEQVLQPVAAAELNKVEASILSGAVAEWPGAGSEARSATEETVQQTAAGEPESITISKAPEAFLATTESHSGVAESPFASNESMPAAGPAAPEVEIPGPIDVAKEPPPPPPTPPRAPPRPAPPPGPRPARPRGRAARVPRPARAATGSPPRRRSS